MSFAFNKVKGAFADVEHSVRGAVKGKPNNHAHMNNATECSDHDVHHDHRFQSFAPEREGNDVKWYVDGCGYMYAVSVALERAQHEIWIMDWWLSPELYLRRPPAKNEEYRIDKMLSAAAKRGVQVNVSILSIEQCQAASNFGTDHYLQGEDTNSQIVRKPLTHTNTDVFFSVGSHPSSYTVFFPHEALARGQ